MEREDLSDRSVGELLQQASRQTADLVREEFRLAQAEMQQKTRRAGMGIGLLAASAVVALYGIAALIAAAIMLLALAVEPWLAALLVAVVLLAAAGIMAAVGRKGAEQATPPVPERTLESVQEDVRHVKERAR
jgi:hypothetical protein